MNMKWAICPFINMSNGNISYQVFHPIMFDKLNYLFNHEASAVDVMNILNGVSFFYKARRIVQTLNKAETPRE